MLNVLYCNEDYILLTLAESLVIGGLPMRTDKLTKSGLTQEIDRLCIFLTFIWGNKDKFIFDKSKKKIFIKEDLQPTDLLHIYEVLYEGNMSEADVYSRPNEVVKRLNKVLEDNVNVYFKRGLTLGRVPAGSGHNSMFKGVSFNMIVEFPLYWLKEYQRYHFTDIISSQSTMHKILEFDLKEMFKEEVDERCIAVIEELRNEYNLETDVAKKKEIWRRIINSCPDGLHMSMGITMNYLQVQSMVEQRRTHKLSEWSEDFIPYLQSLPYYDLFLGR